MSLPSPAVLELDGICKRYRQQIILERIGLRVGRGEIVGLLGPNGSGKTTTLRIAAGYLWPDEGKVAVNGDPVTPDNPSSRRRIGYLPEKAPLYLPFTVRAQLEFVAAARGIERRDISAAISKVLNRFHLEAVADRVIGRLSKGYRQRVGLAQTVLGSTDLLLLDEPTNGLDPFQLMEAREIIRTMAADRGVIFSTHIMQEVEALCSRVVYLRSGELIEIPLTPQTADNDIILASVETTAVDVLTANIAAINGAVHVLQIEQLQPDQFSLRIQAPQTVQAELARMIAAAGRLLSWLPAPRGLEQRLLDIITDDARESKV